MKSIPNTDRLPMRFRNKVWYVRKQVNGHRIDVSLGTANKAIAIERAANIVSAFCRTHIEATWAEEVERSLVSQKGWLYKKWTKCRYSKPGSRLTVEELKGVALRSGGRCEVSGIQFVLVKETHPYQPSIDRIDNDRPYTVDNVRLVCLIVNYSMNRWGREAFERLAISLARRYLERLDASFSNALLYFPYPRLPDDADDLVQNFYDHRSIRPYQ
jgi:hypothetical protein